MKTSGALESCLPWGPDFWNLSCFLHPEHTCLLYRNNLHFSPSSLTSLYSYFRSQYACTFAWIHHISSGELTAVMILLLLNFEVLFGSFLSHPCCKLESKGCLFLIIIVSSTSNTVIPGNKISIEWMKKWMNDENTLPLILTILCIGWNNQRPDLGFVGNFIFRAK